MNTGQTLFRIFRMILITGIVFLLIGFSGKWAVNKFILDEFSIDELRDIHLQVPLRVYTKDGVFIGEFGEQRRIPIAFEHVPKMLVNAVLSAEDDRFFEHGGVDMKSLMRATLNLIKTGEIQQGASTITMQLARNMFLSRQRNFARKFKEMLYAHKMEQEFTKEEILELYLNKIYFGHRAYGISAAAQIYYGKDLQSLTLQEMAMLAGMPQAPSSNNPISNPDNALKRRNYVLKRMLSLGHIQESEYKEANAQPDSAQLIKQVPEIDMPYLAEMVRARMYECYGEKAYTGGYHVITTVDSALQESAQTALRNALWEYSERYGYYGPVAHEKLSSDVPEDALAKILEAYPERGGLLPSLVLAVEQKKVKAYNSKGMFEITWGDLSWARRVSLYKRRYKTGSYPKSAWNFLRRGDVIMVRSMGVEEVLPKKERGKLTKVSQTSAVEVVPERVMRWRLADIPRVEGALVALNPTDGAILAVAGGFDFYQSRFNRVIQAERQPGSSFKSFVYSAALKRGFSPNTYIADTPLVIRAGGKVWQPRNYSYKFYGSIPLRHALIHSYNVASVRLLMRVGLNFAIDHVVSFGFKREKIPRNLTFVLGTAAVTPLEMARGYTVFANGGHLIEPFFIRRIENTDGQVIYSANPLQVCQSCSPLNETSAPKQLGDQCLGSNNKEKPGFLEVSNVHYGTHAFSGQQVNLAPRVISYNNAFAMTSILKDVIQKGTAQKARVLKRNDIAGKTGTTQEARDAWFIGYTPDIVTATWVGFDNPRPLGTGETGGRAALPMWIDFMQSALKGKPEKTLDPTGGVKTTLLIADAGTKANPYNTKPSSYPTTQVKTGTRSRSQSVRQTRTASRESYRKSSKSGSSRHESGSTRSSKSNRSGSGSVSSRSASGGSRSTSGGSRNTGTRSASSSSAKRQTTPASSPKKKVIPVQLF